jgi:outer membrane receptor protein involved in Fe transport
MLTRIGAAALACAGAAQAADTPAALQLPAVNVVGMTPMPGLRVALHDVAANVQTLSDVELSRPGPRNLVDRLDESLGSLSVHAAQGNPYQLDVAFRGFNASARLGAPQGLSVFQDGVRINEPFGDVVNWDLVPLAAIARVQLMPGSNPVFGLNTLGGALALTTKNGRQYPGTSVELGAGSFRRGSVELEHGGHSGAWDHYVALHFGRDGGWAEHNPSRIAQVFGKLGWRDAATELDVTLTGASNRLEGTQTLPLSFLDDPRQAYTWPDATDNRLLMLSVKGQHTIDARNTVSANAYWRRWRSDNVSSNVNPAFGQADPDTGDVDTLQATNDRSAVTQTGFGGGVQWTSAGELSGRPHQVVVGGSVDARRSRYTQDTQPAAFTDTRGTVALGDYTPETDAGSRSRAIGLYAMDTLSLTPAWTLTLSGRLNDVHVRIDDRSGTAPELNGRHRFRHASPAVGLSFHPTSRWTLYGSLNEGMRAPTPMELTCADPAAPCRLPNSFVSDPPLEPVISRTFELGARGTEGVIEWSAALFRTTLRNDIQFVSSGGGRNAGYFRNVGDTRRRGFELGAVARLSSMRLELRYSRVDATFASGFVEHSPANSSADANGDIVVSPGARMPSVPRHNLKLRAETSFGDAWRIGAGLVAHGAQRSRGDENGGDASGPVPGYAVVNLDARWTPSRGPEWLARVDNLFDRRYASFGQLGVNAFTGAGHAFDGANARAEAFRGMGAPRSVWVGLRQSW